MGATSSKQSSTQDVFKKELTNINTMINNIIDESYQFKNKEYNFLSQDICDRYQVILEKDLAKHLKLQLQELGSSLYIIPKEDSNDKHLKYTKTEICEMISSHYVKILYILTLIKYIYNIENNGDRSFGGIILRNIKLVDNLLEIKFCNSSQYDMKTKRGDNVLNMSNFEGFVFFNQYILTPEESKIFIQLLKALFQHKPKGSIKKTICEAMKLKLISKEEYDTLTSVYKRKYGEPLLCERFKNDGPSTEYYRDSPMTSRGPNVAFSIPKHNPVFSKSYCSSIDTIVINTTTKEGKEALTHYHEMRKRFTENINKLEKIVELLVKRDGNTYKLIDIDSKKLSDIIEQVKNIVRRFFIQSIIDYQVMFDYVKNIPNVKIKPTEDGLFS